MDFVTFEEKSQWYKSDRGMEWTFVYCEHLEKAVIAYAVVVARFRPGPKEGRGRGRKSQRVGFTL